MKQNKMSDLYIEDFHVKFNMACEYIQQEDYEQAINLLTALYNQYGAIWRREKRELIICEFMIAQLYEKTNESNMAASYFESCYNKIRNNDLENEQFPVDIQMSYALFLLRQKNNTAVISVLEELRFFLDYEKEDEKPYYLSTIDLLVSVYSIENEHRKSAELANELIELLMEEHTQKHGNILTRDNLDFDALILDKLISLHLGAGASYARLGDYHAAKKYLEMGYFLAFYSYGEQDERTLKLNYNLAANEAVGENLQEGLRQLHFVYEDMVKYLGNDNQYTKMTRKVMGELEEGLEEKMQK